MSQTWRIGIVGPGALGCLFGGLLALAGHQVAMLGRRTEQAEQLAREGLTIERDGVGRRAPVRADTDPARIEPVDLAIVLVKAQDTATVAPALPALLGSAGVALSLQNGLGNVEQLVDVLGAERVLGGVTSQGATLLGIGRVRHAGFGPTAIAAARGGPSPRAVTIASLFEAAGIPTLVSEAVEPMVWGKLVANVAINPLGALLRCPNGALVERPAADALLTGLAREATAVAVAAGVELPFDDPVEHVRAIARATAANRCSMLQDVEAGRRTEIDAINGAVASLGARLDVATPLCETMALLIRAIEQGANSPSPRRGGASVDPTVQSQATSRTMRRVRGRE